MYDVYMIAQYIIEYCNRSGYSISNLKLQKILYFVQAEFLVAKGKPCFSAKIEAWDFGPVVPQIYRKYKVFGSASIPCFDGDAHNDDMDSNDMKLIHDMVDHCAKYSASDLVDITHRQDPWRNVYVPYANRVISNESIQQYFKED